MEILQKIQPHKSKNVTLEMILRKRQKEKEEKKVAKVERI